jgi:hypothetical protein
MTRLARHRAVPALLTLACLPAAAFVAGCGQATVSSDDVTEQVQAQFDKIAQEAGQETFPKVTCPDDLKAEAGETTRCTAKGEDGTLGITVTVKSVKDGTAQLNFKGDDKLT